MAKKAQPETSPAALKWRSSAEIKGYMAHLKAAILKGDRENGAYSGMLDLKSARAIYEICQQAVHTEEGHGR